MSTKSRWGSAPDTHGIGHIEFYDDLYPAEGIPIAPLSLYDDFLQPSLVIPLFGALESGADWSKQIVGTATVAGVANTPHGIVMCHLPAAAAQQAGVLDKGNELSFVLNQGLVFEARVCLHLLPTLSGRACVGLCSAYNQDCDVVASSVWFRWDVATGGLITVENDDTAAGHETSKVTTGVTVVANQWVVLRIDCTEITAVRFYIDGVRVAAGTVFNMDTAPALQLQPVARVDDTAAADSSAGDVYVDYIRVWQRRA